MPFLAVGAEHTSAPLSVRERMAHGLGEGKDAYGWLAGLPATEAIILSTCNRIEWYLFAEDEDIEALAREVTDRLTCKDATLHRFVRTWRELDASEHLFRVASGLESQVPGEDQILAQVADALSTGQEAGTVGANLHALFRAAIACARRARAGTSLGRVQRSLGVEAVRAAEQELGGLSGRSALIVGGGKICQLLAHELSSKGLDNLWIANRTATVASDLAAKVGGTPAKLDDVPRIMPRVDAVFTGTSASTYMLTREDLSGVTTSNMAKPLLIYDLAIPRDVEPEVADLPGVALRDLDALLPGKAEDRWAEDISAIEAVIAAELHEFQVWALTRRVAPVIASLRRHVEAVSAAELQRVGPHLADLTERERAAVESLTNRLIDKMFHHLVMRLRLAAQTDESLVEAAEFFFLHGEGGLFEDAAERQARDRYTEREPHHS